MHFKSTRINSLLFTFFAVGKTVLEIERRIGEYFAAISAYEAFRMESAVHGLQSVLEQ